MTKEGSPTPENDANYPRFEDGPNRHTPETEQAPEAFTGSKKPVAEFTLTSGTELPPEVVEFLASSGIPYYLIHTDSPQPVRLLTDTGIYEGSSILAILGSEEF